MRHLEVGTNLLGTLGMILHRRRRVEEGILKLSGRRSLRLTLANGCLDRKFLCSDRSTISGVLDNSSFLAFFWFFFRGRWGPGYTCPGCHAAETRLRALQERLRLRWVAFLADERTSSEERRASRVRELYPPSDLEGGWCLDEGQERMVFECHSHACVLGQTSRFPIVRFSTYREGRVLPESAEHVGVHLRIHLHLAVPGGAPLRWMSTFTARLFFPLFGHLRRYWGRFLAIRAVFVVRGERVSRGQPTRVSLFNVETRAVLRRPGFLSIAPMTGAARVQPSPRSDVLLQGAHLQWVGSDERNYRREPIGQSLGELRSICLSDNYLWSGGECTNEERAEP